MEERLQHDRILKFISLVRDSFDNAEKVYTEGSCFKFCLILFHQYPGGKILEDSNHAIYELNGHCYDITGEVQKTDRHMDLNERGYLKAFELLSLKYTP